MGLTDRAGRALTRLGVKLMDSVVSALARRPVRTDAREGGQPSPVSVPARATSPRVEPARAEASAPVEPPPPERADVEESTAPSGPEAEDTEREASPKKRRRRRRRRPRRSSTADPTTESPAADRAGAARIVVVARDPETAFVYWSSSSTAASAKLQWLAGGRVARVEEVSPASGKRYLPFTKPGAPHTAVLILDDDKVRSNDVRPPESAPRLKGQPFFIRPDDPNRPALVDAQRLAREDLPRPTSSERPHHGTSFDR